MAISLRLTEEETELFKSYAKLKKISISELIRSAVMEKIEDEYDLKTFNEALKDFKNNPITYSHNDVKKLLEID